MIPRSTLKPCEKDITVQDLLRHTSGLTSDSPGEDGTLENMIKKLETLPMQDEPQARWKYSISTEVIACLVEVLSGVTLDEFLEKCIFKPLRMNDTNFLSFTI